jgi:hypothetical protein
MESRTIQKKRIPAITAIAKYFKKSLLKINFKKSIQASEFYLTHHLITPADYFFECLPNNFNHRFLLPDAGQR